MSDSEAIAVGKALRAVDERSLEAWLHWVRQGGTAVCSDIWREAWDSFRPRTNADLTFGPNDPAHNEVVFLRDAGSGSAANEAQALAVQVPVVELGADGLPAVQSETGDVAAARTVAAALRESDVLRLGKCRVTGDAVVGSGGARAPPLWLRVAVVSVREECVVLARRCGEWGAPLAECDSAHGGLLEVPLARLAGAVVLRERGDSRSAAAAPPLPPPDFRTAAAAGCTVVAFALPLPSAEWGLAWLRAAAAEDCRLGGADSLAARAEGGALSAAAALQAEAARERRRRRDRALRDRADARVREARALLPRLSPARALRRDAWAAVGRALFAAEGGRRGRGALRAEWARWTEAAAAAVEAGQQFSAEGQRAAAAAAAQQRAGLPARPRAAAPAAQRQRCGGAAGAVAAADDCRAAWLRFRPRTSLDAPALVNLRAWVQSSRRPRPRAAPWRSGAGSSSVCDTFSDCMRANASDAAAAKLAEFSGAHLKGDSNRLAGGAPTATLSSALRGDALARAKQMVKELPERTRTVLQFLEPSSEPLQVPAVSMVRTPLSGPPAGPPSGFLMGEGLFPLPPGKGIGGLFPLPPGKGDRRGQKGLTLVPRDVVAEVRPGDWLLVTSGTGGYKGVWRQVVGLSVLQPAVMVRARGSRAYGAQSDGSPWQLPRRRTEAARGSAAAAAASAAATAAASGAGADARRARSGSDAWRPLRVGLEELWGAWVFRDDEPCASQDFNTDAPGARWSEPPPPRTGCVGLAFQLPVPDAAGAVDELRRWARSDAAEPEHTPRTTASGGDGISASRVPSDSKIQHNSAQHRDANSYLPSNTRRSAAATAAGDAAAAAAGGGRALLLPAPMLRALERGVARLLVAWSGAGEARVELLSTEPPRADAGSSAAAAAAPLRSAWRAVYAGAAGACEVTGLRQCSTYTLRVRAAGRRVALLRACTLAAAPPRAPLLARWLPRGGGGAHERVAVIEMGCDCAAAAGRWVLRRRRLPMLSADLAADQQTALATARQWSAIGGDTSADAGPEASVNAAGGRVFEVYRGRKGEAAVGGLEGYRGGWSPALPVTVPQQLRARQSHPPSRAQHTSGRSGSAAEADGDAQAVVRALGPRLSAAQQRRVTAAFARVLRSGGASSSGSDCSAGSRLRSSSSSTERGSGSGGDGSGASGDTGDTAGDGASGKRDARQNSRKGRLPRGWRRVHDGAGGAAFYVNDGAGVAQWTRPQAWQEEAVALDLGDAAAAMRFEHD
ncbi:hypothetical protein JKP88DRAFT_348025 [Tribonema minus]|uniref:WW domain-containing protein n=1 Tax=Tribonema minus TaxID=303371 RepID=A0A835ZBQ0_9STRA|nr:hypothetical protein JKP88DRAFT_348025 [Tribonema minus]